MKNLNIIILVFLTSCIVNLKAQDINQGLVAYWSFDNLINNAFPDLTGNGNTAYSINNVTVKSGVRGNCAYFNGSSYLDVANDYFMNKECNITATFWIRLNKDVFDYAQLLTISDIEKRPNYDPMTFQFNRGKPTDFAFENCITQKAMRLPNATDVSFELKPKTWYHITIQLCFNGNYSVMKYYVNGTLISTVDYLQDMVMNGSNYGQGYFCLDYDRPMKFTIGRVYGFDVWSWVGEIDELRFYNRCLSDEEIKILVDPCEKAQKALINTQDTLYLCNSSPVILECLNNNVKYEWTTGSNQKSISVNQPGTYTVTITDTNNCTSKDSIIVKNKTMLFPKINLEYSGCKNDSINVFIEDLDSIYSLRANLKKASTHYTNQRQFKIQNINDDILMTYTDVDGCTFYDTVKVEKFEKNKIFDFNPKTEMLFDIGNGFNILCENVTIQNTTAHSQILESVSLKYNTAFSTPQSQFPMLFNPNETKMVEICFYPNYNNIDTLIYKDICDYISIIPLLGNYKLDDFDITSKCDVKVNFVIDSIYANVSFSKSYPNPANQEVSLDYFISKKSAIDIPVEMFLVNCFGETISKSQSVINNQYGTLKMNTENVSNGIYYILLFLKDSSVTFPISILK